MRTGFEIAVIGMAGRFPGARDIREFWNNLQNGVESIMFLSDKELEDAGVNSQLISEPGFVKSKVGGVEERQCFDASFFEYPAREAAVMSPQIRCLHEYSWAALEDAGYNPFSYNGAIALYAGAASNFEWKTLAAGSGITRDLGRYLVMQLVEIDYLATRVSYKLNLKGPAVSVQTACSTSLVAIHLACRSLLSGECSMALAGGVTLLTHENFGYIYEEGMISSPDGHCRAFDRNAGGTAAGEGIGMVVLKPLEEAEADGDHIYAVIKGSAINNDGLGKAGYTAPGIEGQAQAIIAALHMAEVQPESISYIETHGTGTNLGDPTEIEALKLAFNTDKKAFCAIGSVKTNIGHLDRAAGVAGFIKTVLALKHKQIPQSLHFETPNPRIDFENSPFFVNTGLKEWKNNGHPLRAGVSSFGIGGTNAHVVLEEGPPKEKSSQGRPWKMIMLSAKTGNALNQAKANLKNHLMENPGIDLADGAYTLQTGRRQFQYRQAFVCSNVQEALEALSETGKSKTFYAETDAKPSVVFMFPGQGTQYVDMGRHLYENEEIFRQETDHCLDILKSVTGVDLKEVLYPAFSGSAGGESAGPDPKKINRTDMTQPLIFIFEYALASLLLSWGIKPDAMIGHSIGEYTAACLSGVFSLEHALELVATRGRLMQEPAPGTMISVSAGEQEIMPLLKKGISLAAVNTSSRCVISGTPDNMDALEKELETSGFPCSRLHTSHAFHSAMMDPVLSTFREKVRQVRLNDPAIPFISNITGNWLTGREASSPDYWADHLRRTVRFADGINKLGETGPRVFIEVGPGNVLSTFARELLEDRAEQYVIDLVRHPKKKVADHYYLLNQITYLWLYGGHIDWEGFYKGEKRYRVPLPAYAFANDRYWLDDVDRGKTQILAETPEPGIVPARDDIKAAKSWTLKPRPNLTVPYAPPVNPLEETLAGIWSNYFGIEPIGRHDDFFQLGGDSLRTTSVISIIHKQLDIKIPLETFFTASTINKLGEYINTAQRSRYQSIAAVEKREYYPLSSAQKRLYALQQLEKNHIGYNETMVSLWAGEFNREKLAEVLQKIIARHEILRTSVVLIGSEPVQKIVPASDVKTAVAYEEIDEHETKKQVGNFVKPFELGNPPFFRIGLLKIPGNRYLFIIDMHHIITDGVSQEIFIKECMALYRGEELPGLKLQYKDYSQWQQEQKKSGILKKQEEFWLNIFAGELPILELPTDYTRPSFQSFSGENVHFTLDKNDTAALKKLASDRDVTLFMVLLAIFNIFLSKLSGQEDIVMGTPVANRRHAELDSLIGVFVNTLPLRNFPGSEKTFSAFLQEIKAGSLKSFENQDLPLEELVDKLEIKRDMARNPLFDVLLALQTPDQYTRHLPRVTIPGLTMEPYTYENRTAKFDLSLEHTEIDDQLSSRFEYCTKLFNQETVKRFVHYYKKIVASILEEPGICIGQIEIITEHEKERILHDFNDTAADFPGAKTIHGLFSEQAARTVDRTALIAQGGTVSLSFRLFNEISDQLAAQFLAKGVKSQTIVGIMIERSIEMMAAIFAVLKGGGAYMPIDPAYPPERVEYMLKDASVRFLVINGKIFSGKVPVFLQEWEGETIVLDDLSVLSLSFTNKENSDNVERPSVSSDSLIYVMCTSGSTGKPRGVMIGHRSVVNRIHWMQECYPIGEGDVVLQKTPVIFDVSVWELFWWGIQGAMLYLLGPGQERDPGVIVEVVERSKITTMHFVPSMLNAFLDYLGSSQDLSRLSGLKRVFSSGEALLNHHVERFHSLITRVNGTGLINLYGPTEATVDVSYFECALGKELEIIPIGKPINNINLYVMDKELKLQPIGVVGELCIGGVGLARGYLNRPELTLERFVNYKLQNTNYKQCTCLRKKVPGKIYNKKFLRGFQMCHGQFLQKAPPGRRRQNIYKTGDLVRWLSDGNIDFLGRIDQQVKIRGMRVELGEIESRLLEYNKIKQAVVLCKKSETGDSYLCAYLVAGVGKEEEKELKLKEFLSVTLPGYMIPSYFIFLEQIPLTPGGKVDRKALPDPGVVGTGSKAGYAGPRNEVEKELVEIWKRVLGRKVIGIHDNFLEVGGDSIKSIQVTAKIREAGYGVELDDILQYPTISRLVEHLKKEGQKTATQSAITGQLALTPIQAAFFKHYQVAPDHFNQAVMFYSQERLDREVMREIFLKIQGHHDALRMTYKSVNGEVIQENHGLDHPFSLEFYDFRDSKDQKKALEIRVNEIQAGIDLENGPLMKLGLFRLSDGDRLLIVIHHLVIDGVSWRILFEDIDTLYRKYKNDEQLELPAKTDSFKLWSEKLYSYAGKMPFFTEAAYMKELASALIPEIRKDFKEAGNYIKDAFTQQFSLGEDETAGLSGRVNETFGTEINDILLTALGLAVGETFAVNRLLIALESHGREEILENIDISRTVGWFTSEYPVLLDISLRDDLASLIKEIKKALRRLPNRGIGYGILKYLKTVETKEEIPDVPVPQVRFNYLGEFYSDLKKMSFRVSEESIGQKNSPEEIREEELEISGMVEAKHLVISVTYNTKHFKAETIETLLVNYKRYLTHIISFCSTREEKEFISGDFTYDNLSSEDLESIDAVFNR